MTLEQYLNQNRMSLAVFARAVGSSASTVLRVRDGQVIPSRKTMAAIEKASNGQVTAAELIAVALAGDAKGGTNDH